MKNIWKYKMANVYPAVLPVSQIWQASLEQTARTPPHHSVLNLTQHLTLTVRTSVCDFREESAL
jgi:hypothetical protein